MPSINPACKLCSLYETANTVCIAGEGPRNAQIMLVGEAPGAVEDDWGRPFVGKAGQLLDMLLKENGFNREEIFVTNAIRCRPPDNRDPSAKEIKACKAYLVEEIERVQPQLIVSLGNHALKALTGESGVIKHRGSLLPLHSSFTAGTTGAAVPSVFAATHPAAALYYPDYVEQVNDDLRLLRRTVNNDFVEIDSPYVDCRGVNPAVFAHDDILSFDLETNGLDTHDPFSRVYLCGIDGGAETVAMYTSTRAACTALEQATRMGIRAVGHNSSAFDRLMLKRATGTEIRCDDTMLIGWCLHEHWGNARKLNLESLCVAELGVRPWKKDVTWDWSKPREIPWDKAKEYCARDTRLTRQLFFALEKQLKADGYLWTFYDKLMLPASRAIANMEERGLYVNNEHVAQAEAYYTQEMADQLEIVKGIAASVDMPDFKPGSTQQVAELLFERLGLDPVELTPKGAYSTNVGVLKTLRENLNTIVDTSAHAPLFDALLKYRKCRNKMLGTYIAHYKDQQNYWQMAYPWTSLIRTVTGRTASDWQQIPREQRIRRCVGVPPGMVLLEVDYAQIEARVASSKYVFDEPNLRAAFEQDLDIHTLLAAEINGILLSAVTKEQRQDAKPPNYMFMYGGEEEMYIRTLLEDSDIVKTYPQARRERDAFFRRWSGLPAGHRRTVDELKRQGRVRTLFGTLRRLPNVFSTERRIEVEAYREAVNTVVSAPTCHMALIGLVLLDAAGLSVHSFQHDGYLIWVEDSERAVRAAAAQIRYLLEHGVPEVMASEFGIDWDVPLKVDLHAGTAWTEHDREAWVS